jgi:anti-sigma factor RsiW
MSMYSVPDDDLEFLESYLDDALSDEETAALRQRLANEPNLMAALRQLREERSQRQAFFQSIDPSPKEVEKLLGAIHRAAERKRWWQDHRKLTRWGSAVAACMVFALVGGFFYNASGKQPLRPGSLAEVPTASIGGATNMVTPAGDYEVEVPDFESGKIMAVQHFRTKNEADDFTRDLRQVEMRHRQSKNGMTVMDNEF